VKKAAADVQNGGRTQTSVYFAAERAGMTTDSPA